VIRELSALDGIVVETICSGQHREMLRSLIEWFELKVDGDLAVMTHDQSLSTLTARLLEGLDAALQASQPDLVIAQGDTTTVMCASLACFYRGIAFAHVEAGLRTFDLMNPFPEEFNRVTVGKTASLNFCPTERAKANILAENAAPGSVHLTGNSVIDALQYSVEKLGQVGPEQSTVDILVTAHRRENFGRPLAEICQAIERIGRMHPHIKILYPVHPNPNVRKAVTELLSGRENILLVEPLSYPELVSAMRSAKLILTDSGGIQEEAPALGKPVLVLRAVTERPEAVELGLARVVGTDSDRIVAETNRLLTDSAHYARMARGGSPYGDGKAAARIAAIVSDFLQ
jgi:UDP-N-acetylglucosamine 2-epimerase (non-hydrolysing)